MIPSLETLLAAASRLHGLGEGAIRLGHDEQCLQGLGAFMWMAREATEVDQSVAALFAGRSLGMADSALGRTDFLLTQDDAYAAALQETLFEVAALDEIARLKGRRSPELTPEQIARRILDGRASATTVGAAHIRQLAAALLALDEHGRTMPPRVDILGGMKLRADAVRDAWRAYERDQHGPQAAIARRRLDLAAGLLADELDPIIRTSRTLETTYG